jgi:hypothetical protein
MPWVESVSPSFRARHDSAHADEAAELLETLEQTRERLSELFPRPVDEVAIVLHGGNVSLSMAHPIVPVAWLATAPAARRYVAGWSGSREIHMLAPSVLQSRASKVPGSREMLERAACALYARQVIASNNHDLANAPRPARPRLEMRWAWLLEGAARWFSGQTEHSRPAIARRLREGRRPRFPPGLRDAPLLGGTVIDLLVREQGEPAAAQLACRLHPQGARGALSKAFCGRSFTGTEGEWHAHLARMAAA